MSSLKHLNKKVSSSIIESGNSIYLIIKLMIEHVVSKERYMMNPMAVANVDMQKVAHGMQILHLTAMSQTIDVSVPKP